MEIVTNKSVKIVLFLAMLILLSGVSCTTEEPEMVTIGVVNYVEALEPALDGLKIGMAERGYVEGETIQYIYNGVTAEDEAELEGAVQALLNQEVDLIFALGSLTTQMAQQMTANTEIPVVFAGASDPLGDGLIDSIQKPGQNTTGVLVGTETANSDGLRLQWLVQMKPDLQQVLVPYSPDDVGMVANVQTIEEAAQSLGVEIITVEIRTPEEAAQFVANFPEDVEALMLLVDRRLARHLSELVNLSIEQQFLFSVPVVSLTSAGVLMAYGSDFNLIGQQAANLVEQILNGTAAGDIPVEEPEIVLSINMNTAAAIGLEVPSDVLTAAYEIIR